MDWTLLPIVGGVAVLLAVSAFFSSAEIALFSLPIERVRELADTPAGRQLAETREDSHRLLVTLLVGNNVVNIALSSIVTVVLVTYLPPSYAAAAATLTATTLVLVFGEILPKTWGLANAEAWSLRVVGPMRVIEVVLYPLVVFFDALTGALARLAGGETEIEREYVDEK
ncbi:CNNM domain-containing protein [Salarchaeum sp. JOR-1]|uniref:CNNM domain-containing protein n=1 Tax=Salarchaeum sp. JOR-1 TaxID=2599399 RepID=UPI001198B590|nr:DUF21 domain-containing protein [Salarchaeum sp. JOR-1]QDX39870.1 DUF21 domain-containing protein [Salarchaeum sp. JOR-1]